MAISLPKPVSERVKSVLEIALLIHQASAPGPSAQKGAEREVFVNHVLKESLPPTIRFGTGSVSDLGGNDSGQLDIVLESASGISFSMPGVPNSRYFLANQVGAVIEVKSTLNNASWERATATGERLSNVRRSSGAEKLAHLVDDDKPILAPNGRPFTASAQSAIREQAKKQFGELEAQRTRIPYYVVAYRAWKSTTPIEERLEDAGNIDGVFVIEGGFWVSRDRSKISPTLTVDHSTLTANEGHTQLVNFMTRLREDCEDSYQSLDGAFS